MNENGRGVITGAPASPTHGAVSSLGVKSLPQFPDNLIRENQWGGVDIRRGGDPVLKNNFICYGYSDGVVVGERGRGLIEGNHVYCMLLKCIRKLGLRFGLDH